MLRLRNSHTAPFYAYVDGIADTLRLERSAERRAGASPAVGTISRDCDLIANSTAYGLKPRGFVGATPISLTIGAWFTAKLAEQISSNLNSLGGASPLAPTMFFVHMPENEVKQKDLVGVDALTGRPIYREDPKQGKCPKCGKHSMISRYPSVAECLSCGYCDD